MAITKINTPEIFDLGATNTSLKLPSGDTASRPTNPSTGEWRYNTTLKYVEYYDGSSWRQIQTEKNCTTNTVDYPTGATTVAYYKLDYSAIDETTNNYDGTTTDITYVNGSPYSQAAVFNGSSSKIVLPDVLTGVTNLYSFSVWVKIDNTNNFPFFTSTTGSATSNIIRFALHQNGNYYFDFGNNSSGRMSGATPSSWRDGNWHNFVFVSTSTQKLVYVDGLLFDSKSSTVSVSSLSDLTVGHYLTNYGEGEYDQIRIYSSALTSDQVTELYEEVQCPCTTNTVGYSVDGIGSSTNTSTLAYYKLDGNANDSTANANNGTWGGTESYAVSPYGVAGVFNGTASASRSKITTSGLTTYNTFSISFWANPDDVNSIRLVMGTSDSFVTQTGFGVFFGLTGNGNLTWRVSNGSSEVDLEKSSISTGNWYHIVITQNISNNEKNLYVNGVLEDTSTSGVNATGQGHSLVIGGYNGATNQPYDGKLDQIRVYSSALTSSQVTQLYEEVYCNTISTLDVFGGNTGVALYQFENNANSTDSSSNNGTWGGTEAYAGGYFDKAASFDGASYIDVDSLTSVFGGKNTVSVSFWFNTTTTARQRIFSDYAQTSRNIDITIDGGNIDIVTDYGSSTEIRFISSANYNDGNWHHIVVAINQSTSERTIYIDNSLKETATLPASSWNGYDQHVTIGAIYAGGYGQYFIGSIDQVRIFNTALTQYQVTQLFSE